jgi:hypothetical protein
VELSRQHKLQIILTSGAETHMARQKDKSKIQTICIKFLRSIVRKIKRENVIIKLELSF